MANPQKVSFAQLRVGIMAFAAMIIVGALIFLLTSRQNFFTPTFVLRTYMDDSSGMTEGAPVRLNGILVGELDQLKLTDSKDPRRTVDVAGVDAPVDRGGEIVELCAEQTDPHHVVSALQPGFGT